MKDKIIKLMTKNRFLITLLIVLAVVATPICLAGRGYSVEETEAIFQIIVGVFVIAGVVIAVWQYYISTRTSIHSLEHQNVETAIKLSEYYKDQVLRLAKPVMFVYSNTGIKEILEGVDKNKFENFDKLERETLFTKKKSDELKSIIESKEFADVVVQATKIFALNHVFDSSIEAIDKENNKVRINLQTITGSFMEDIVCEILNDLEYFAMNFTHEIADETVVYSSLHQTYIEIMQLLYYQITEINDKVEMRYYTNAIELYKKWKSRQDSMTKSAYKETRTPKLGTKLSNIKEI